MIQVRDHTGCFPIESAEHAAAWLLTHAYGVVMVTGRKGTGYVDNRKLGIQSSFNGNELYYGLDRRQAVVAIRDMVTATE